MEDNAQVVNQPPKFAADHMLIRLARWLRLMGADVICDPTLSGAEILRLAREQKRPLLTRDKRLRTAPDALYIETHLFRDQIREVMDRYPFDPRRFAFTRCSFCNQVLKQVPRDAVVRSVPPFVYSAHEKFAYASNATASIGMRATSSGRCARSTPLHKIRRSTPPPDR
jgi:hypothetical protein